MRYKVPQNVEREDQVLWFITLRQLIMLLVGGGISYLLFINLAKGKSEDELSALLMIFVWSPLALAALFAFLKIKGMSIAQIFLLVMEHGFFRYPRRYWIAGAGEPDVSMTTKIAPLKKKMEKNEAKDYNPDKAHELAEFLDHKTYYSQKNDD